MSTRQTHNVAGGNIIGGDLTINSTVIQARIEEIQSLYERLKRREDGDDSGGSFCEKLEHYMSVKTSGDVRGLEDKLKDSGRLDQLELALEMKEWAAKSIMRHQASKAAQRIYTIVLDELHTSFVLLVTPVIQSGGGRPAVDATTLDALNEVKAVLGENFLEISVKDLLGFLFFLGGNCHIRWDKC